MNAGVLYIDPPWQYRDKNTGGSMSSGAEAQYEGATMTLEELAALDLGAVLGASKRGKPDPAVLALWTTTSFLEASFGLIRGWGFTYKAPIVWNKTGRLGMGHWLRIQSEFLLLAVRGDVRAFKLQERNVVDLPALDHSTKPEHFRGMLERATARVPGERIEIFARRPAPGWTTVGLELGTEIRAWLQGRRADRGEQAPPTGTRPPPRRRPVPTQGAR